MKMTQSMSSSSSSFIAPYGNERMDLIVFLFVTDSLSPSSCAVFSSNLSIKLTTRARFSLTVSYSILTDSTSSLRFSTTLIIISVSVSPS